MAHYDQDVLALLAMGESDVTTDGGAHLSTCAECRAEAEQFAALVAATRQVTPQDRLQSPPDHVWQRILSEIAAEADAAAVEAPAATLATVSPIRRRPHPALLAAAAAIVGVLVGVGATYAANRTPAPPPVAVTQIALQPLDAPVAHGTAALGVSTGGQRTLTVTVAGLPTVPGTFYEVWLMNASPQRLIALGVLDTRDRGTFQIPAGLDLSSYPVVDISLQPFNGSPAHSGTSEVRGSFRA